MKQHVLLFLAHAIGPAVFVTLGGCSLLMGSDFNNGTEVASIGIGKIQTVTRSIDLPLGDADLRFVVRDYDCKVPLVGTIGVSAQFADGESKQYEVKLGQLTWPRSGSALDCVPIAYLELDDGKYTRPLQMTITRQNNPVNFTFNVTRPGRPKNEAMSIWVVYNDRSPVRRMLGH